MEPTMIRYGTIAAALAGVLYLTSAPASTQTTATRTPRAANAADPAAAPAPKLPDGHPDLNGTWDNGRSAFGFAPNDGGTTCVFGCAPAGGGGRGNAAASATPHRGTARPTYKPEFIAKVKDLDPSYLGDSAGRWEKDTLVVEAVNFNDDSWLIDNGAFHTTDLRVVERLRRVGNTIEYEATAYDPAVLAEPWVMRPRLLRLTNQELSEPEPCVERSLDHLVTLDHHDNPR